MLYTSAHQEIHPSNHYSTAVIKLSSLKGKFLSLKGKLFFLKGESNLIVLLCNENKISPIIIFCHPFFHILSLIVLFVTHFVIFCHPFCHILSPIVIFVTHCHQLSPVTEIFSCFGKGKLWVGPPYSPPPENFYLSQPSVTFKQLLNSIYQFSQLVQLCRIRDSDPVYDALLCNLFTLF